MAVICKRLLVVGLGLIGGSMARAARQRGLVAEVLGVSRSEATLRAAEERGVVDKSYADITEALAVLEAGDVILIATPTLSVPAMLKHCRGAIERGVICTDAASVKGSIAVAAEEIFGCLPANLVLGHPIAGSEQSGIEAVNPELYVDHRIILTPADSTDASAIEKVSALWQGVGGVVSRMSIADHDKVLAATSHLPHVLAFTLVDTLAKQEERLDIFRYAAGGFRDFTRIAGSDPVMWHDIVLANDKAVLQWIAELQTQLTAVAADIEAADSGALLDRFARAKAARERFLELFENIGASRTPN